MYKLAWLPDSLDPRDRHIRLASPAAFPASVPIIGQTVPIKDQLSLGACVGTAVAAAVEIIVANLTSRSALMAYFHARALIGEVPYDAGSTIRDAIKSVQRTGLCAEATWPYVPGRFSQVPSRMAYAEASEVVGRIESYERVTNLQGVKTALASGLPVIFGFLVPDYFMSAHVAATGQVRDLQPSDALIGAHAVVAVGYEPGVIICRNSWSADWGADGYFTLPEAWFDDPILVSDMWVLHPMPVLQ